MKRTHKHAIVGAACISRDRGFARVLLIALLIFCSSMDARAAETSPGRSTAGIAGDYLLQGVMETASGFRLSSDGTYRFFLAYGSVDETDSGTWQLKGTMVVLHSAAPADDPNITFVRSFADDFEGVRIHFEGEGARLASVATTIVLHADGREFRANEGADHTRQSRSAHAPIHKIDLSFIGAMREYRQFAFEPQNPTHNNFVFQVTVGNYGSVRFNGTHLQIGDNELVLMLPNMRQKFRYVRE